MCDLTAQLVEHRTGVTKVTGSNPVEAMIFFRILTSNCFNWKIYCDDHSSLSSTTAVQHEFHTYFTSALEPLNESIISHVTFSGWSLSLLRSFLFYGTTQTPHCVGFCFCPLNTIVVTRNWQTSFLHKCSSFMAKNASKAFTKNNTSRKQTRQPGFTDGNDNGAWNNLFYFWRERHAKTVKCTQ